MIGNEFERLRRNILINMGGDEPSDISYLVKTDNSKIYFELANTPIANFCTIAAATASITVNGQSVVKNTIKEIVFGISYQNITSIPNNFLRNFTSIPTADLLAFRNVTNIGNQFLWGSSIISVNLSAFKEVEAIGEGFFNTCSSLSSLDISPLIKLGSIGLGICYNATSLTSIKIGSLDFSNITVDANNSFQNAPSGGTVYADTTALAGTFKNKYASLYNWSTV